MERDEVSRQRTFLPLSRDEGIEDNGKGLPQLPGDAGAMNILSQEPDGSSQRQYSHLTCSSKDWLGQTPLPVSSYLHSGCLATVPCGA